MKGSNSHGRRLPRICRKFGETWVISRSSPNLTDLSRVTSYTDFVRFELVKKVGHPYEALVTVRIGLVCVFVTIC